MSPAGAKRPDREATSSSERRHGASEGPRLWVRVALLLPLTALLAIFFTIPLCLMAAVSVARQSFGAYEWAFTLTSYARFLTDPFYLGVLWDTLWLGAVVTLAALLLGYPLAYHLAR